MKLKATVLCLMMSSFTVFAAEQHKHWGYSGDADASHWGDLEPGFTGCKLGKEQSPIDIQKAEKSALQPLGFSYGASAAEVVNNGHTIQVNLKEGGSVKLKDGEFKLLQFHFHTPSEEKINGEAYPLVAHLVHKNAEGKLAVVAVLFKVGKENGALKPVFDALPAKAEDKKALDKPINATDFLPVERGYYAFMGSLTTPPCSEGVRWQVLKQSVEISEAQLGAFKKLYAMNARPVQPLNGRKVLESQ